MIAQSWQRCTDLLLAIASRQEYLNKGFVQVCALEIDVLELKLVLESRRHGDWEEDDK